MRSVLIALALVGVFLGWNAPNHYPPWPTFHLEVVSAMGIAMLGLALATASRLRASHGLPGRTPEALRPSLAVWVWLAAAMLPLLQFTLGQLQFRGDALLGWLYGAGAALAIYLGQLWYAQEGNTSVLRKIWLTVLWGGLAANGLALHQWAGLGTPGWWAMDLIDGRPYGNFGQPNNFGLLMVWAIVAALALYEQAVIESPKTLAFVVAFLAFGAFASQSRASLLALAVPVLAWLHLHRTGRSRLGTAAMLTGLVGIAALFWLEQHARGLGQAPQLAVARDLTEVGARKQIWLHFWAAIQSRPWLGYGFNQSIAALADVAGQVEPSRNTIYAHNVVLDLMVWFGIPVALALSVGLLAWVLGWLRRCESQGLAVARAYTCAAWLALLVQSLLEFPYAHAYFLLPACLLAGCVSAPAVEPLLARRASRAMLVVGLVAGTLLGLTAAEYVSLEDDFRFNRFARANFTNRPAHESTATVLVLDQLAALNRGAELKPRVGMSAKDLEDLRVLARRFHILSVRFDYAKALALNGQLAEAENELIVIRAAHAPAVFSRIRQSWDEWLREHRQEIAAGSG